MRRRRAILAGSIAVVTLASGCTPTSLYSRPSRPAPVADGHILESDGSVSFIYRQPDGRAVIIDPDGSLRWVVGR
ncbi:MAG: hypothetical protein AAF937_05295 [Planctomycetota bacterium]